MNRIIENFCYKYEMDEDHFYGKEKFYGNIDLRHIKSIPAGFNPIVGGSLILNSVKHLPLGFNPVVALDLEIRSVKSIPTSFNPVVGRDLDLSSVTSIPEGFNPVVGGDLILPKHLHIEPNSNSYAPFSSWQDGKYIKVEEIFTEVLSKKKNVWKVKELINDNVLYLITDGNENYAHGDSIKDALESLICTLYTKDPSKCENFFSQNNP